MATYREHALNAVENIMRQNLKNGKTIKPEIRFLHALKQNIGITKYNGIAANETEYVAAPSSFIGFREDSTSTM